MLSYSKYYKVTNVRVYVALLLLYCEKLQFKFLKVWMVSFFYLIRNRHLTFWKEEEWSKKCILDVTNFHGGKEGGWMLESDQVGDRLGEDFSLGMILCSFKFLNDVNILHIKIFVVLYLIKIIKRCWILYNKFPWVNYCGWLKKIRISFRINIKG